MKLPESLLSRLLLAYLPFMAYSYDFFKTCVAALWIVAFLWITVAFFWFTSRLFPDRSLKLAFSLWLIVWAQAIWTLTKLPPYWIVSVFFLMPVSFLRDAEKPGHVRVFSREVPRYFFERILAGISFVGFVMLLALLREIAGKHLGIQVFTQPAGMLFVFVAVAFLWKKQTYPKRPQQTSSEWERR